MHPGGGRSQQGVENPPQVAADANNGWQDLDLDLVVVADQPKPHPADNSGNSVYSDEWFLLPAHEWYSIDIRTQLRGGGIGADSATVDLWNSELHDNVSIRGAGGAISLLSGSLSVEDSLLYDQKMMGEVALSQTYLRFDWSDSTCSRSE